MRGILGIVLLALGGLALAAGEPGRATPQPYGGAPQPLLQPRSPAPQGSAPLLRGPGAAVAPSEPRQVPARDQPLLPAAPKKPLPSSRPKGAPVID